MSDRTAELLSELRSLLDETTILSIAGDYDLTNPDEFAAVRDILLTISQDVPAEEATGFNPSGLGADQIVDFANHEHNGSSAISTGPGEGDLRSNDGLSSTTDGSHQLSALSLTSSKTKSSASTSGARGSPGGISGGILDDLSYAEKEQQLEGMFTSLKPVDIKLALKKSGGNASLAIDSLLNLQWLEQTGQRIKGVDGFYISDEEGSGKQKKGKKKKKKGPKHIRSPTTRSEPQSPSSPGTTAEVECMDDEQHDANIAFISEKLNQPASDVTNIYYRHGNSTGATICEVFDNFLKLGLTSSDPAILADVSSQSTKYPWIPREYIGSALELSPSYDFALEVIEALSTFFEKPAYMKYNVAYSVIASDRETEIDNGPTSSGNRPSAKVINIRPSPPQGLRSPISLQSATINTSLLAQSRDHSYASAGAAFRKGRSDPLYRQAAGYYAERAREQATNHRQAVSVETNLLVDQQSTRGMVDLHGATVQDGVEIALDRCWRWWESLRGEDRAKRAKEGFVVVTGLGRHTTDGRSRLRTNVFKALVADGWKAEVLTGAYLITDRRW